MSSLEYTAIYRCHISDSWVTNHETFINFLKLINKLSRFTNYYSKHSNINYNITFMHIGLWKRYANETFIDINYV